MNIEIKGDSHRTVEMNIHLVLLLMAAKSVLGSSSNWRKKVKLDSVEDSIMDFDTQEPDDPDYLGLQRIQRSTELFSDDRNKAAASYPSDKSTRTTGFALEGKNWLSKSDGRLSRMDCRRRPESRREWLIGFAFVALCKHFGPRVRDEIVSGLQSEVMLGRRRRWEEELGEDVGDTGGYDFDLGSYATAFEIQKPALARCFKSAHDYYCRNSLPGGTSSSCISRYPACLGQLAINPRPDFQILWLKNYPRVLEYFDRVRKGQRTFQQARIIAQELLKCGLIDRSNRWQFSGLGESKFPNRPDTINPNWDRISIDEILEKGPSLFDVCRFPKITWLRSWNIRTRDCLRRIVRDLLIHEAKLQENGETLEPQFFGGNAFALNVLYAVKCALEEDKASRDALRNQEAFLKTIIQSILQGGVLQDDLSNYPWANHFLSQWQTSIIKNLTLRLVTTFLLTKGGTFGKTCLPLIRNKAEDIQCLRRIAAEIMRVESQLIKEGSSLQGMFSNHPILANCVALINQVLRKSDNFPVVQRSLNINKNQNYQILKSGENILGDSLDDLEREENTRKLQIIDMTKKNDNPSTDAAIISEGEKKVLAKKVADMFDIPSLIDTIANASMKI